MSPKRRFTRKEIKKEDEFISTIDRIYDFLVPLVIKYKRWITIGVVIAVGVTLFLTGWHYYRRSMEEKAQAMLFLPIKIYHLPVGAEAKDFQMRSDLPRFSTLPEKFQYVLDKLGKVIEKYPSSDAAAQARYYQALCYFRMGKVELAIKKLKETLDSNPPKSVAILASYTLGEIYEGVGKNKEAIVYYQRVLNKGKEIIPEDEALWRIASCYINEGKGEKALPLLQRIIEKFPNSPHRDEAEKEANYISPQASLARENS